MDGTTIAAIITASGAVVVGVLKLLKPKPKEGVTSTVGDVTDSMVAVGTNINQTFRPTVHNHYVEPAQNADLFSSKVESTPTIADIMNDLDKERKPYEANQVHKHYVGLRVCWPVTVYGVWEGHRGGSWTIRLPSADNDRLAVTVRVDIEDYPKLKVVERGHRAWVEGRIRDVNTGDVYLEDGAQITLE